MYVITMKKTQINFDATVKITEEQPELAKCCDDFRQECVEVHRILMEDQNPAILKKNIHELNEKLRSIAKEIDDTVDRSQGIARVV
jgi:uncharacterized coiled-coil DUF342 family protein